MNSDEEIITKVLSDILMLIDDAKANDESSVISGACSSHEHYRKLTGRISAFNDVKTLIIDYKKTGAFYE